ncbi:MAG: DEAD/DEAH box helicase family protein [Monoglobaceae bacterium]
MTRLNLKAHNLCTKIERRRSLKRDTFPKYFEDIIPLGRGYVSDEIGDEWQKWTSGRAVIINCPTGSGKNTFIEDTIVRSAIYTGKTVLICSNRVALDVAVKRRICEKLRIYKDFNDAALHELHDYGNISIYSYQSLSAALNDKKFDEQEFDYTIFDEVHYFATDAMFSSGTGLLLYKIPKRFRRSIRIYMSATIDEIKPYIYDAECSQCAVIASRLIDNIDFPLPRLYTMKADFSKIKLKFYTDDADAEEIIKNSIHKSILFVDSKAYGRSLHESFADSLYMDSDTKASDPEVISGIISKEKFSQKLLITTAVFENGCNIKDSDVKNVFIQEINPSSILQMAGRRRLYLPSDSFDLYLKIPNPETLSSRICKYDNLTNMIDLSKDDPTAFMRWIVKRGRLFSDIQKIVYAYNGKYCFDPLTEEMIKSNRNYAYKIKNLIEAEGIHAYCQKISHELFGIEFSPDMLISSDQDNAGDISDYLESFVNKELEIDEMRMIFQRFKDWYTKTFGQSKSDNRGKERRSINYTLFNNRLQEYNMPFIWTKSQNMYQLRKTVS